MTIQNIKKGFQKTGIYPFDKFIFNDDDFIICSVTDRAQEVQETERDFDNEPSTSTKPGAEKNLKNEETTSPAREANTPTHTFISPQQFQGYPKAAALKTKRKSRQRGRSMIATDTSEKDILEEKQRDKIRKVELKKNKKKVKRVLTISSDEENDINISSGGSSDDVDLFEEQPLCLFTQLEKPVDLDDFVLVEFEDKKKKIYYIGKVAAVKNEDDEYMMTFLRKSSKYENSFIFPAIEDISLVKSEKIKMILPNPLHGGTTKRQQSYFRFEIDFSSIEIR